VIPVAQWGSNHLLPPTSSRPTLLPRATLRVLAGPPVALDDLREGRIGRTSLQQATDRIMGRITEQLAVLRGEEPPAHPEPHEPAHPDAPAADLHPPAVS
jgi:1-acyl-sn-glycerol-3-phosphate acyltransferase